MKIHDAIQMGSMALLALLVFSSPVHAESSAPHEKWTFAVRPYLWLPNNVDGTLKYNIPSGGGGGPEVDVTSDPLRDTSYFALMLYGEARKGNWAIVLDFDVLSLDTKNSKVKSIDFPGEGNRIPVTASADLGTQSSIGGDIGELVGAYTMARNDGSSIEILAGVRYFSVHASLDWQLAGDVAGPGPGQSFGRSGSMSQRAELWDGIVGIRGSVGLGSGTWAIPYYLDVGTGTSALTGQAMAAIAYNFHWGDVQLFYRYLYFDMKGDKFLQGFGLGGPGLGVTFRF
jgi:hypothetical protein